MTYSEALERKYQVFISSTFNDLWEYRQRAIIGVIDAGHMPVALENYAPSTESKKDVIKKAMRSCQYYIIILGARYGTIPHDDPNKKSYVEIELDMARDLGLKILVFAMKMDNVKRVRDEVDFKNSEEMELIGKYKALREKLTKGIENSFYNEFDEPYDIEKRVLQFFSTQQSEPGYMLEPPDSEQTKVLQIYARNEIIRDVVQRLGQFETVEPRLAADADKKAILAEAFAELWGEHVRSKYKRVFLESGSTITYIAKELSNYLPKRGEGGGTPEVLTNNAFAYLYLWLCSEILCRPVPSGPPDKKYGGMYGELTRRTRMPTYDLRSLELYDPDARDIIKRITRETFGDNEDKRTLILAAISGIQVTDKINAVKSDSNGKEYPLEINDPLWPQVSQCRGFHVGSYENHLFKRSYYRTRYPTIVFVHDEKIDCKIVIGKCHFLCDSGYPWSKFAQEYPLSIWVACDDSTYKDVFTKFQNELADYAGWTFGVYRLGSPYPIVIGNNDAFKKSCEDIGINIPVHPQC